MHQREQLRRPFALFTFVLVASLISSGGASSNTVLDSSTVPNSSPVLSSSFSKGKGLIWTRYILHSSRCMSNLILLLVCVNGGILEGAGRLSSACYCSLLTFHQFFVSSVCQSLLALLILFVMFDRAPSITRCGSSAHFCLTYLSIHGVYLKHCSQARTFEITSPIFVFEILS